MNKIFMQVTAAVAAISLTAAMSGCGAPAAANSGSQNTAPDIMVTAAKPTRGDLELTTSFVGSVQPDQVISVLPKMPGIVKEIKVTTGQQVKKGEVLMVLDDKDILPAIKQAEAGYNSAKAQADKMIGSSFKSGLAQADSEFDRSFDAYERAKDDASVAESAYNAAKKALENLQAGGTATPEQIASATQNVEKAGAAYDLADSAADTARKYYNNARNSYNAMKTEGEAETKVIADTTIDQAKVGLDTAKQNLEDTKVTSPIDGVVESVSVSELNMASTGTPAFVISNKEKLSVSFSVPSASIAAMQVGEVVTVQKGQNNYSGTITEVNTVIDQKTGLFTVKASLDEASAELLTGVMVKVTAPTQRSVNTILLAQDSVYFDNGKAYVYIATPEGLAKKVFVETGISTPEQIEVTGGIADSDVVITSWHPNLIDGVKIAIEA